MSTEKRDYTKYSIESQCQASGLVRPDPYGSISYPIYQAATFEHVGLGESTGFDYSRVQNPTREELEAKVALLEKGTDAVAFSSGMAAITALLELFRCGDEVIADVDLYGGTDRLFREICERHGVHVVQADCTNPAAVANAVTGRTKALYVESPTNPMMRILDLKALAAEAKKNGLLFFVDNTFLSPYLQNPLELGADVSIHSGTKYLSGHNDTLGGFLITRDRKIAYQLREIAKTTGGNLAPFDSWLILRGLKTLAVRMDRAQENATALAEHLTHDPHVTKVLYPGLKDHPGYEINRKQASGAGAMITIETDTVERAVDMLNRVQLVHFAESLGGTETLITYPVTQTHEYLPREERERLGITEKIIRISVGIENINDLYEEFDRLLR